MFTAVAHLFSNQALQLGGSDFRWHKALFCPNVRDDGSPCFDEVRGTSWKECPVCNGTGCLYASPVYIKGIYTDNSNRWQPDGSGGFIKGDKTLSLPRNLDIRLLKDRPNAQPRRLLRDKFELLGPCCDSFGQRPVQEVLYALHDPTKPTIQNQTIYQMLNVGNNY